jgi:PIN domain nuclease of toxin-antitoxin system
MSGQLLLDTHVLLWALLSPARLTAKVRRDIERSDVFVSAASIWEIAIKQSIVKIKIEPSSVLDALPQAGFDLLPIEGAHAVRTADLGVDHKDPFDRMLLAQAMCESMILLTNDEILAEYRQVVRLV